MNLNIFDDVLDYTGGDSLNIFDAIADDTDATSDDVEASNDTDANDDVIDDTTSDITGAFNIFSGGAITYDADKISKDEVISEMMPEKIGECLIAPNGHCMSEPTLAAVAKIVGSVDLGGVNVGKDNVGKDNVGKDNVTTTGAVSTESKNNSHPVIEAAKQKLGCDTEVCVLKKLETRLGPQLVHAELETSFKLPGPTDTKWLSNYNIDGVMRQFTVKFPGFYAYNFNMSNYTEYSFKDGSIKHSPDTLHTIPVSSLIGKYKTFGCVINTGSYQSKGEHWMALFVDTRSTPYTVEFFNSSGGGPRSYAKWLSKTQDELSQIAPTEIVRCDVIRHQQSMSECGLYSLFYIYSRLLGTPYTYFQNKPIPDKFMFEFRQHLFEDGKRSEVGKEFSWEEYQKEVPIKWEK